MAARVILFGLLTGLSTIGCTPHSHSHSHSTTPAAPEPRSCPPPSYDIVDLTQRIHPDIPVWPGGVPFSMKRLADYPDAGYRAHELHVGENTGTHVDAPSHFVEGGRSIDQLAVTELVVPVVVIDVSKKVASDPDYAVSGNDIVDWEDAFGPIPVGGVVLAYTGWASKFNDPKAYVNQDDQGVMHFPGFGADAAALLVERDVAGIGIDTLSLDPGKSTELSTHKQLLEAGKYMIENLTGLERLPTTGAVIIVGVLPIADGTQAQARVMALIPEGAGEQEEGEGP